MEREWLGGRYGLGQQFESILWLELQTGILLGATVIDPAGPIPFGESLRQAMAEPGEGPPRRPTSIRVPDQAFADALRSAAGGIPVVIAPVPELDEVFTDFHALMEAIPAEEETVHQMDFRLVREITRFAAKELGDWLDVDLEACDEDERDLMISWATWTTTVGGTRVADHYFAANEQLLADAERDWIDAQRRSWLSIWEATAVEPGRLSVRDVLSGETRVVVEELGSRTVAPRAYLLARMIDYRDASYFGGMHRRIFPAPAGELFATAVRRKLGTGTRHIAVDRLRDRQLGRWMIESWSSIVRTVISESRER